MMKNVLVILSICVVVALGDIRWAQRGRVKDFAAFYSQVIQETVYEIERRGFSSLKLIDVTQNIDSPMYRWRVNGTAKYTNGFLVSIQKLDVTGMAQALGTPSVDGVPTPRATVSGTLNMYNTKLGYDVTFTEVDGTVHKFTGDLTHGVISWPISIQKDLRTKEITVTMTNNNLSAGLVRMVYRPASNVTEVLSRVFLPGNNGDGIGTWPPIIIPIIEDIIKNKFPFPDVCYSHC